MGENPRENITELHQAFLIALKRIEFDDLQNELNDIDTGRLKRFLSEDQKGQRSGERSKARSASTAAAASRLQLLLASNPAYAKLYNDTFDQLRNAERATELAIQKAQAALGEAQTAMDDLMDRAARLPDGTRVFKDERGQVRTDEGKLISDVDAEGIVWRDDAPSYQEFLNLRESVELRVTQLEALQGYQVNTLGRIRDRMMEGENPSMIDELQRHKADIQDTMPEPVRNELIKTTSSIDPVSSQEISVPVRTL